MLGQKNVFFKHNVLFQIKRNRLFLAQMQNLVACNRYHIGFFRINRLSFQPHKAINNRFNGSVPFAGQRQRTVKRRLQTRNSLKLSPRPQIVNISFSRPHRTDGMRTRRADPNRENLQ